MDFQSAIRSGLSKWITFSGRSSRSEFWYWILFVILLSMVLSFIGLSTSSGSIIGFFVAIFFMVAYFSIAIRRLHDLDKSGWWMLLSLFPVLGTLILMAWFTIKGTVGSNQYGADPLDTQNS